MSVLKHLTASPVRIVPRHISLALRLASGIALVAVLMPASVLAANTFRVSGATGSDIPACGDPAHPCATIQFAVNKASAGDTILVAAGQYNENDLPVLVDKPLTILGAQAGRDGRTRALPSSKESTMISSGGAFNLQANTITIDGFTTTGQTSPPDVLGTSISTSPQFDGYRIVNNIIRDNSFGLYLHSDGDVQTLVQRNRFQENNQTGAASGNGIYSDQGIKNALIDNNLFVAHANAGIIFVSPDPLAFPQQLVTISNNRFTDDFNASIFLVNVENFTVQKNTSTGADASAIFLGGGNDGVDIIGNSIANAGFSGIRVRDAFAAGTNLNIDVLSNTISGVGSGDTSAGAVKVTDDANRIRIGNNVLNNNVSGIVVGNVVITDPGAFDVFGNRISKSAMFGIDLCGASCADAGPGTSGVLVRDNGKIDKSGADGLRVRDGSSGNTLRNNKIKGSGGEDALDDGDDGPGGAPPPNTWTNNDCRTDLPGDLCER
jgi:hypothetical protein